MQPRVIRGNQCFVTLSRFVPFFLPSISETISEWLIDLLLEILFCCIAVLIFFNFHILFQGWWDFSFCYSNFWRKRRDDTKTWGLSSAARICGELLFVILKFRCECISYPSFIHFIFLQGDAVIWCIGWQKSQGQGVTILGGLCTIVLV